MCKPDGGTESQIKLRLFGFSLTRRENDWLQFLPSSTILTWIELEDNFLEIFFTNAKFVERKAKISNFSQGGS